MSISFFLIVVYVTVKNINTFIFFYNHFSTETLHVNNAITEIMKYVVK